MRNDFATLAKTSRDSKLTNDGAFLGSPGFMAPEQFRAEEVDGRADVFAIGAVLSVILTGAHPFAGDDQVDKHKSKKNTGEHGNRQHRGKTFIASEKYASDIG